MLGVKCNELLPFDNFMYLQEDDSGMYVLVMLDDDEKNTLTLNEGNRRNPNQTRQYSSSGMYW